MNAEQDEAGRLLSGYIDGELTPQERQRVELMLQQRDDYRRLYEQLQEIRSQIGQMERPDPDLEQLEHLMHDRGARTLALSGWILLIPGVILTFGVAWLGMFAVELVPWIVGSGVTGILAGLGLLLGSVLRQRLLARKHDKYRKVKL